MWLRCSFGPRPKNRALATTGSFMIIGLSINGFSHTIKPVWRGKTRLTCPKVQSAATSKPWRDSGRASFYPPHSRRQKKALSAGWVLTACLNVNWDLRYVEFIPGEMNTRPRRSVIQIHCGSARVEQSWESGSYSFNFSRTKEMSRRYWHKSTSQRNAERGY